MKLKKIGAALLCGIMAFTSIGVKVTMATEANDVQPVVKYDFESVDGKSVPNTGSNTGIGAAEIIGSGTIVNDIERGNVFYNHASNEYDRTVRTNYLQLDSNIFKDAIDGEAFSLTMWMKYESSKVNISDDWQFRWADIFVAYDSDNWDKYPMVKLGVNLIGRVNNTVEDRNAYFDTSDMGDYLSDNQWHKIAYTISTNKTSIYVDGKEIATISFNGDRGKTVGDLFSNSKNLIDTICIGGNSLWNEDPDMCAMFDDICIYNVELTKEQLSQDSGYIEDGVSFNDLAVKAGKALEYTIDTTVINESDIKTYEWYVGTELVSSGATSYSPKEEDIENTITLKVIMNDGSYTDCKVYYSIFPVLYMDSETGYGSVDSEYVEVDFNLTSEDYETEQLYNGKAEIRIRGNSTAGLAKRPFKVKLDSKANLFGHGESKHWVLLADAIDVSLLRNKILQGLAGDLGLDYMESEYVSLVYNGKYQGVYELSEHVRVGNTRVDIFDWEDLAEDGAKAIAQELRDSGEITEEEYDIVKDELEDELVEDYSWVESQSFTSKYLNAEGKTSSFTMTEYLDYENDVPEATGGVLLEMDFWYEIQEGKRPNIYTAYALPIYTNTPDSIEVKFDTLVSYIDNYVQAMEYSLHSTDFVYKNDDTHYAVDDQGHYRNGRRTGVTYKEVSFESDEYDGWHYTDFLDIDSAINNMLICEISLNWDSMKNSFFMYKDIDGKMIFGPVWDFDWAWGNSMGQDTNAPETWQTTNEWFANEQYYQTVQWNRLLIRDPYFVVKLYERYHEVRDEYIEPLVNVAIDEMSEANTLAAMANDARWGTAFSATAGQNYSEQVEYIHTFLDRRLAWLDEQFESIDTLNESLGYYVISEDIQTKSVDTESEDGYTLISVDVDNEKVKKVSFQVNGKNFYIAAVSNGTATVKVPDNALVSDDSLNVVQYRGMDENSEYVINALGTIKGNYTNAITNYTTFTKNVSDDEVTEQKPGVTINKDNEVVNSETETTTTINGSTDIKGNNNGVWMAIGISLAVIVVVTVVIIVIKKGVNKKNK